MNIIVCVKQATDPEAPPSSFKVDPAGHKVVTTAGVPLVIDPYSEYAVEAALRIKDAFGGTVTTISLGANLLPDIVKKPLAMGTDQLILLEDEEFADGDSYSTASALAAAIKKIGDYELILCGREAADTNAGQVGPAIAEMLGRPSITLVKKIAVSQGKAKVERVTDDGYEVIEVALPALLTVSHEIGEPRYPTIKRSLMAKKIEPTVWKPADIGLAAAQVGATGRRSKIVMLFQPVRDVKCEIIDGESAEEAGVNLALRLREAKLI